MDTSPNKEVESTPGVATPSRLLAKVVEKFTPPNARPNRTFIVPHIWKKHPSLRAALPRVAVALADSIYANSRDGVDSRMVAGQACMFFIPFAGVMSPPLVLVLCLSFAALLIDPVSYAILTLRFDLGYSCTEIGEIFRQSRGAIKEKIRRTVRELQKLMSTDTAPPKRNLNEMMSTTGGAQ